MRRSGRMLIAAGLLAAAVGVAGAQTAADILGETKVEGGLIVHVGCGHGQLTAALRVHDRYVVHGLDTDAANVARARQLIRSKGLCGPVSIARFDGRSLPYADNLVDLVVSENIGDVSAEEILRVLSPGGVAYVKTAGKWAKTVKPHPTDTDEWTHYLHDPSNNAVAHDKVIGPPKHLQWQCGPRWSRHHDHMASVSAMVSAGGRLFSIVDEGSRVSPQLPSSWKLIARDAFNGVLLWKRPIEQWHTALWPLKSGPANLPRRLVAVGDVVYVTLGSSAPVTALDAATGRTLRVYENTAGAEEILHTGRRLLVLINRTPMDFDVDLAQDSEEGRSRDHRTTYSPEMKRIWAGIRSKRWSHGDRSVLAFEADSGRALWQRAGKVIPLTLAADADNAYFHDGEKVVAVALEGGKDRWATEAVPVWRGLDGQGLQSWFAPTLVATAGQVLFAGGEKINMSYVGWATKDIGRDTMTAFSAATGKKLWTAEHPFSGYNSPEDLFVAAGRVWTGTTAQGGAGRYTGHDPVSGEVVNDFPPDVKTFWFHHRCHRAKATDRFILSSRTGIEFVDLETGKWTINHWIRGGCLYGIMPCNGMIYVPPNPCACYPESMVHGFAAVAPTSPSREVPEKVSTEGRLEKGPAYSGIPQSAIPNPQSNDWPTYRHDAARSGGTAAPVAASLQTAWDVELGGKLTQPVVAGGRLFVADVNGHVVHAIDAASGKVLWSHVTGGRVDSPPTICGGRVLFGSAEGYVTCLRATDGELAWRFRAAPIDRRIVAFEQVESAWPVHGSVLVQNPSTGSGQAVVYCVAGRSMFLDGGLRLVRLDVETGKLLGEKVLDDRDPVTGGALQDRISGLNMPVALPDILSSDGQLLYMRSQAMDLEGNRAKLGPGVTGGDHLFAAYGFTDDSWFHRTYWLFGGGFSGGVGGFGNGKKKPAGRILANNDTTVFSYGRKPNYYRWSSVVDYQLFAAARPGANPARPAPTPAKPSQGDKKPAKRKGGPGVSFLWTRDLGLMVRAMALAGDTLFIAGPADVLDEDAAFQSFRDAATQKQIAAQDAALKGRSGATLQAVEAGTGRIMGEYKLKSPPVFDGLIAAGGCLYLSTTDGRIVCMKSTK